MFINNTPLVAIIDTEATHSFISTECAQCLNLLLSSMGGEMVIDTPASGSVTTSLVCLSCPLTIYGRDFAMDLVCLPLKDLDVILGMNWLEFNRVNLDCYHKLVRFLSPDEDEELNFLSTKELKKLLAEEAQLFGLFASLTVESQVAIGEFPVVCGFPEVFPDDFS